MKKKILFIINNLGGGGAERLVVDDINEMVLRGFDVYLITLRPEFKTTIESELKINPENKFLIDFKKIPSLKSWIEVVRILKEIKPDLILSHLWLANTVGRVASVFAGVKNIVCFEQNVYDSVKTKKMFFIDFILQFFCKKVVAVSFAVKKSLIRHLILSRKIDVLENSVNPERYINFVSRDDLRIKYGFDKEDYIFLFIGRLIPQKSVDILLRGFKFTDNSKLIILGEGYEEGCLKNLTKELDIENKVSFLGFKKKVNDYLNLSDVFVLTSEFEGLPLVVTEAIMAEKPIIVSDFDATKGIFIHQENSLIFKRGDYVSLGNMMNFIKNNAEVSKKVSSRVALLKDRFSIGKHCDFILNNYL